MSTWTMTIKNSANVYVADGTINRPMEDMETQKISTTQRINMADGSTAFVTPSTKSRSEPFTMFFANTTAAFRTKITYWFSNDFYKAGVQEKIGLKDIPKATIIPRGVFFDLKTRYPIVDTGKKIIKVVMDSIVTSDITR